MSTSEIQSRKVFGILLLLATAALALIVWRTCFSPRPKKTAADKIERFEEEDEQERSDSISDGRQIRFLKKRMALLERKVSDLDQKLSRCRNDPSAENRDPGETMDDEWEEEENLGAADPDRQFATVMASESSDYDWSSRIKKRFDDAVFHNAFSGASLQDMDCRETVCHIHITLEDPQKRDSALSDLGFLTTAGEEMVTAMNEDSPSKIDAYFRRPPVE